MSPNNGKNIINLDAVRAHKTDDRELQFTPQTSSRNSRHTVNRSTTRRPTPRRRPNPQNGKRDLRNSYSHSRKNYQASLKKNYEKLLKLVATGLISASLLVGGVVGYNINNHITGNIEYSLDEYNPTELFNGTNEFIKEVAEDKALSEHPNLEDTLSDYYIESYNESSVSPFYGAVTLQLNYINRDPRDTTKSNFIPIEVTLPKDFAKNVYLPYKDLRDTSQQASSEKKEKTSYWLKINKSTTELTDGLKEYSRTTEDKQYSDLAQTVLDNAKTTDDNGDGDGR